jgi:hypothetical protein
MKLNQKELIRKFIGTRKLKMTEDTELIHYIRPYCTGLEGEADAVSDDQIIGEAKQLWGFNRKDGIYIVSLMKKGLDIELIATWFISDTKFKRILHDYFHDQEHSPWTDESEFISPDRYEETITMNGKPVSKEIYVRIK